MLYHFHLFDCFEFQSVIRYLIDSFLQSNTGFKLLWDLGLTNIKRMFGSSLLKSTNIESTNPKTHIEDCNRDGVHVLKGEKLMALLIVFEYM